MPKVTAVNLPNEYSDDRKEERIIVSNIVGRRTVMKDRDQSRVASILTVISGAWLMVSPLWIEMTGGALANILIVGGLIGLSGLVQLFWTNTLPSWINGLVAVWLFASAFLFTISASAAWNMIVTAAVVFVLAVWDSIEISHMHHNQHARI